MIILSIRMMKPTPILVLLCILYGPFVSMGATLADAVIIDLRGEWMIYKDGDYQPVLTDTDFDEKTIYIAIDLLANSNSFLHVTSVNFFSIFVNGKLFTSEVKEVNLSIDSIRSAIGAPSMLLAIYQPKGVSGKRLDTTLLKQKVGVADHLIIDRGSTYFRDFVVLGVFIILFLLILIVGQNPKLAADYFSLRKLFAASVSQDSLSDNRTTSSSNILFQSFCSVLGGFVFTVIFTYIKDQYDIATLFSHHTLLGSILIWLVLSAVILAIFFTRQLIIYLFAYLFGMQELAVAHYFNLIRLLFWILGLSAVGVSIYLIVHEQVVHVFENVYFLLGWILGFWVVLIFFKLRRRVGFSMFHLFSYLCATEIIPLIITIKVLYY